MTIKQWIKKILFYNKNNYLLEDAYYLLEIVLCKSRSWIITYEEYNISNIKLNILNNYIYRRLRGEPLVYILRRCWFLHYMFVVYFDIFIPRKETELLVEYVINIYPRYYRYKILDLGTGSGVIALTLGKYFINSDIFAVDINRLAVTLAKYNMKKLMLHNVVIYLSDWFSNIINLNYYDVIISNPPYIDSSDYISCNLKYENLDSLVSSYKGIYDIYMIIKSAWNYLKYQGQLIIEHDNNHTYLIHLIYKKFCYKKIYTYKDYNSLNRFTTGIKSF